METIAQTQKTSITIKPQINSEYKDILTNDALCFIEKLEREFRGRRKTLLNNRKDVQKKIDSGW